VEQKLKLLIKNNFTVLFITAIGGISAFLGLVFGRMSPFAEGITPTKIVVLIFFFAVAVGTVMLLPKNINYEVNLKAVFIVLLSLCFEVFAINGMNNQNFFLVLCNLSILLFVTVHLHKTKQLTNENAVILIILASFFIQLSYILATSVSVRQHDVGAFNSNNVGHASYIEHFVTTLKLPNLTEISARIGAHTIIQFYHPPVHYFLAALWVRIQLFIKVPLDQAVEGIQFLTMFYSTTCVIVAKRIFEELDLEGKYLPMAVSVVAFCPVFIIFSGSINNDVLSVLFFLAAMLATIKWMKSDRIAHLLQMAIFIGMGMSTKFNAGVIAVPIAAVMLTKLIKEKNKIRNIKQYAIFAAMVFPLGLWWPVRNLLLYGTLPSVPRLPDSSNQYVGFRSLFERYIPFVGMGRQPYFRNGPEVFEYNVWSGLFKSSAFGEFSLPPHSTWAAKFAGVLFAATVMVCTISFLALLYSYIIKKEYVKKEKSFMVFTYAALLVSYIGFCYQFPHMCTMNVRYVSPLVIVGAFFLADAMQLLRKQANSKKDTDSTIIYLHLGEFMVQSIIVFYILSSVLVYTLLNIPKPI